MYIGPQATLAKSCSNGLGINFREKLPLEVCSIMCFAYSKHVHGNTSVMGGEYVSVTWLWGNMMEVFRLAIAINDALDGCVVETILFGNLGIGHASIPGSTNPGLLGGRGVLCHDKEMDTRLIE